MPNGNIGESRIGRLVLHLSSVLLVERRAR
jgi:hypothetical protein